jgi:hypothetical protein
MSPRVGRGTGAAANPDLLAIAPELESPAIYFQGTNGNNVSTPDAASLDILGVEGTKFLSLPGVAGNYASTPDAAALDITGDIDIRVRVAMDDWTLSAGQALVSKYIGADFDRSWWLSVSLSGTLQLQWSTLGTAATLATVFSTAAVPAADGAEIWVRATLDVDNGAGGNTVQFFTSADGLTWTQLGADVITAGTTSIRSGNAELRVGQRSDANSPAAGKFYRAQVLNGIGGTVVFDADFTQQTIGATTFTESSSNAATVTINGTSAKIVDDTCYGYLPGVTGSYYSTPDAAALDITGDIELVARVAANDWTPSAEQYVLAKYTTTGNQRSYALSITTTGKLALRNSTDGTNAIYRESNVLPFTNGTAYWVKAVLDVDTGSSTNETTFYWAADQDLEPTSWTTLSSTTTTTPATTTTSIYSSTAILEIGSIIAGASSPFAGKVYNAIVRSDPLGTPVKVFDAKFDRQIQFASSFVEDTGKTVTVNGNARINRNRDLDIRVRTQPLSWTASSTNKQMFAKRATTGDQRSWLFDHTTLRLLLFYYAYGGTSGAETSRNSGTAVPFVDGQTGWVRVVLDVDNGAGGHVVTFYTAPDSIDEPTSWTELGTGTVANVYSLFPGTATLNVGSWADGGAFIGKMYRAVIRNGIDGEVVGDWQARGHLGGVRYTDQTGKVWTINGSAWTGVLG